MPISVAKIEKEILSGLPNEAKRRDAACVAADYYALNTEAHAEKREAEGDGDFLARPKASIPFARRVVRTLSKHLYRPGPVRQIQDEAEATDWLAEVYQDNLANSLWQKADAFSLLCHAVAFQVHATGDDLRPLKLHLWQAHEFAVYPSVGDPECVVTISLEDQIRTYTLWTDEEYRTYRTDQFNGTSGGILPRFIPAESGPNPYGVLPFSFVHAELPTAEFWVGGLGCFLVNANKVVDGQLSDLVLAIKRFLAPIGVAENCGVEFDVINKMGAFVTLVTRLSGLDKVPPARLSYLQANLDIAGAWQHIENSLYTTLDALEIPRSAFRMDQPAAVSGAASIAEQVPLIEYAEERREPFRKYETDLARVCFAVSGSFYGDAAHSALADDLSLMLAWPLARNPIPSIESIQTDDAEIQAGYSSRVMKIMERFGLSRDMAIERIKQIAIDKAEADEIDPPVDPYADPNVDPNADPGNPANQAA